PSWSLDVDDSIAATFGGSLKAVCAICGKHLHRLIEFAPVPTGLLVTLNRLVLATCLSCLGWESATLFYVHDKDGLPRCQPHEGEPRDPENPARPLQACEVGLAATPSRWCVQDWALADSRENLNKIGGPPCWIQSAAYPDCPNCSSTMMFLAQF